MHYLTADIIFNMWIGRRRGIMTELDFPARKNYLLFGTNNNAFAYQASETYRYSDRQINKIIRTNNYHLIFLKKTTWLISEAKKIFEKINKTDLNKIKTKEIINLFKKFYSTYSSLTAIVGNIRNINWTVEERLASLLKTDLKEKYSKDVFYCLTAPTKRNILNEHDEDFLKILKKIRQDETNKEELINNFLANYAWLPVGFNNEESLNFKEILAEVNTQLPLIQKLEQKLRKIRSTQNKLKKKQEAIYKSVNLSEETIGLVKFVSEANFQKDNIRFNLNRYCHFALKKLLKEIAGRFKIKENEAYCLLPKEIIGGLKQGTLSKNLVKLIRSRRRAYYFLRKNGKVKKEVGQMAIKLINQFKKREPLGVKEIRGTVACKGEAKGEILVAIKAEEINERTAKDKILVVPMTTPEFMPILPKVKAIITDEGGITCHSAIVSRELKIPCLIGTQIATKVFKDGDMVEVDTEKGIVRKIN